MAISQILNNEYWTVGWPHNDSLINEMFWNLVAQPILNSMKSLKHEPDPFLF